MSLPKDQNHREKLNNYVKQAVQLKHEQDTLKEDLTNISDMVKDEIGMAKKEFNGIVKAAYDKAKIEETIEELQTSVANVEILAGV